MENEQPRSVALTDVKQMRALAHPLRMQVLGELRINGPRTAGALSEVFGEAPGTLSYHLRKLAEFGFVEEVPELAADRREHWWRAAHEYTQLHPVAADAPVAERMASAAIRHQIVDSYAATLHRAIEATADQPREWVEAAGSSDAFAFLTAAQLAEATAELEAVITKWHDLGDRNHPGAEAVHLIVHAVRRP
ncbi:MAG TPA: helix-turn-helix domain-containing protein [Terrimesophilobacter sp.]|nr:helix-turn-helix domain-containing protein [Terrimesophilobacter sp.]